MRVALGVCLLLAASAMAGLPVVAAQEDSAAAEAAAARFHDAHFHLTNYVQRGITLSEFLATVGNDVGRTAVFGIPLQQKWDYFESADRAPDYYLHSDAALYYYSFVDAIIAEEYQLLSPEEQERFDPMITGFNPTDMYAADHIRRVLTLYPGVFSGVGEFSIHKEFVTSKILGHGASLRNPALDRVLDFAGEVGLAVILHNDIDVVLPTDAQEPVHLEMLREIFRSHPDVTIIWAHTGLGRFVGPAPDHVLLLDGLLSDEAYSHVHCDLSWDEVAKYVVRDEASLAAWAALLERHPDRFLFGTDSVAPASREGYLKTWRDYQPLWERLSEDTRHAITRGNYERVFDAANRRVRLWEARNVGRSRGAEAASEGAADQ